MRDVWDRQLREHAASVAQMDSVIPVLADFAERLCMAFANGGTLYTFGNGGSAADAQHFAAELVGHYCRDRRALPAVALTTDPSVVTCIGNDYDFSSIFSRQVGALARPGDVVVAFSTSGTSPNVVSGLRAARDRGATTVLLCGRSGSPAAADVVVAMPAEHTARIQEMHVLALHLVSEWVDDWAARPAGASLCDPASPLPR